MKTVGEFREPCDWWFHSGITQDMRGNQIPKGYCYCANKESDMHLSRVCPRQTCKDYTVNRNE